MFRRLAPLALALGLAAPALAFDFDAMSEEERAAFRAEVRAYLLDNPEVLMEAIGVLEQREQAAQVANDAAMIAANAAELFADDGSFIDGNPDGDITIVEFLDYRCGFCRRAHPEVAELLELDGNIRLVVKEFPILGEQSLLASRFAVAVLQISGPNVYDEVHDTLMAMETDVTEDSLARLADTYGLPTELIMEEMYGTEVEAVIAANHELGQRMGINGTPTFVFGDQLVRGYIPLGDMAVLVDRIRAEG